MGHDEPPTMVADRTTLYTAHALGLLTPILDHRSEQAPASEGGQCGSRRFPYRRRTLSFAKKVPRAYLMGQATHGASHPRRIEVESTPLLQGRQGLISSGFGSAMRWGRGRVGRRHRIGCVLKLTRASWSSKLERHALAGC